MLNNIDKLAVSSILCNKKGTPVLKDSTMIRLLVVVGLASVFAAGSAFAGSGCNYGSVGHLAKIDKSQDLLGQERVDPQLLALLKKQEEKQQIELPVIHN